MDAPGAMAGRPQTVIAGERDGVDDTAKTARREARVMFEGVDGPVCVMLSGRMLWTLGELFRAGQLGVTPLERPAPRWSHYVFQLRALGFDIETIREDHGGPYPGRHGRYVLRSPVAIEGGAA